MLESWALLRDFGPYAAHVSVDDAEEVRELIDHILERYHEVHREEFPAAIRLARKVEAVHADVRNAPHGLADHLGRMFEALEAHQQREERALFPAMRNGGCAAVRIPIARMMAEHRDAEDQLVKLRTLTRNHTAPDDACRSWRALCEACRKLDDDLVEHMRIENEELFARFV